MFKIHALVLATSLTQCTPSKEWQIKAQKTDNAQQANTYWHNALITDPFEPTILNAVATHHRHAGNNSTALAYFYRSLRRNIHQPFVHKQCAEILRSCERYKEALEHYDHLLVNNPHDSLLHFDAALTATMIGLTKRAINHYAFMLKQMPQNIQLLYNMGYVHKMAGNVEIAIQYYQQVITLKPDYEPARFALALAFLAQGDFKQGWSWYAEYLEREHLNANRLRTFLKTNSLQNKRLLLRHQGGLGDTLQFVRFAQLLHNAGAHITASVPTALHKLLALCPYIDALLQPGQLFPSYDDQTSFMALPAIYNVDKHTACPCVPYLFADQALVDYWGQKLAADTKIKIGICWQADVHNDSSRMPVARRGIPLTLLVTALQKIPHISIYSLQQRDGLDQLALSSFNVVIKQFDEPIDQEHGSFMDTAAIMHAMDLIITVDTATAHLAGGLGRPVWLLLPYSTDWRWIVGKTDSPWYPTMRIFKQDEPLDWTLVTNDLSKELSSFVTNYQKSREKDAPYMVGPAKNG